MGFKFVLSLIFAAIVAIFAIQNADAVNVSFIVWNISISQALIILVSALLGAVIVMMLSLIKQVKLSSALKGEKKTTTSLQNENKALKTKLDEANAKLAEAEAFKSDIMNQSEQFEQNITE